MAPPATVNFDLTTIALINDIKFNNSTILDLMDKLVEECLPIVTRHQGRAAGQGSIHPLWSP